MQNILPRVVSSQYADPVDIIWLTTAARLGMNVVRSAEVYASWDGNGTLQIGTPETLDSDDCLAQMIFHEICHALVEGPERFNLPDWGLDADHIGNEEATLCLQAALANRHGLRRMLAATTDFRGYFDSLADDPFLSLHGVAREMAEKGWHRALEGDWSRPLSEALEATARVKQIVEPFAKLNSLWCA